MPLRANCKKCHTTFPVPELPIDGAVVCPGCGQRYVIRARKDGPPDVAPGGATGERSDNLSEQGNLGPEGASCGLDDLYALAGGVPVSEPQRKQAERPSAVSQRESGTKIEIVFPGLPTLAVDWVAQVILDGKSVGQGSVMNGFALHASVKPGKHKLVVRLPASIFTRTTNLSIDIPSGGPFRVELSYSMVWGKFSNKYDLWEM